MNSENIFFVAEIGANHCGSLELAISTIQTAADAGADAVKLQTFTPDEMTLDCLPPLRTGPWAGSTMHELYRATMLPWEWHEELFKFAQDIGLVCFSTPFSLAAVDRLETLDNPIYKIASPEINYLPLIHRAAKTGKPMIISTGMATINDIERALYVARAAGAQDITLLKCVSAYPASEESFNLATLADMRQRFGVKVGLSDHSIGCGVAVAAVALGAAVIEKHFTISRKIDSPDSKFSAEPDEFARLVGTCSLAKEAIGGVSYGATDAEESSLQYRRSLWITQDLRAGDELTMDNVAILRPAGGLQPQYLPLVLGRCVKHDIPRGTPLTWDVYDGKAETHLGCADIEPSGA